MAMIFKKIASILIFSAALTVVAAAIFFSPLSQLLPLSLLSCWCSLLFFFFFFFFADLIYCIFIYLYMCIVYILCKNKKSHALIHIGTKSLSQREKHTQHFLCLGFTTFFISLRKLYYTHVY